MQFASLEDLIALGASKVDSNEASPTNRRAVRLIELVSAQVAHYVNLADQAAFDALPEVKREVIAAVVAEAASQRLSVSAAASVTQYPPDDVSAATSLLAPRHYRALDRGLGRVVFGTVEDTADASIGWWP